MDDTSVTGHAARLMNEHEMAIFKVIRVLEDRLSPCEMETLFSLLEERYGVRSHKMDFVEVPSSWFKDK